MKQRTLAFSNVILFILALAALALSTVASAQQIGYRAVIKAFDSNGTSLGYLADDPTYWTPLLNADVNNALIVDFILNGTSGAAVNLTPENSGETGFPYFGLVVGRDSTNSDIASGNFNYLYIGNTDATPPNSTPQLAGNYFSANGDVTKASESAVWTVDATAKTLVPVWVNSDSSKPTTQVFVQSNHVYAGGDADQFHNRFPAPVTAATLHLEILSTFTLCAPGSFSATGGSPCMLAPAGSYVSGSGATSATLCPAGSFSSAAGATACTLAPAGSYVGSAGSTAATPCRPGTFSSVAGATACTLAPAGSFVSGTASTSATPCPPGTFSSSAGATSCTVVPAGSYAGAGSTSATPCAPGSFSSLAGSSGGGGTFGGGAGPTACTLAPAGSYVANPGSTAATPCAIGTFSSVAGATACRRAPAGSFVSGAGSTAATPCAPGTFSSTAGARSCTLAPAGSFDSGTGNTSATACPAGTASAAGASACTRIATTVDQCRNGGWLALIRANGTPFRSQADCIQYVTTGN